MNEARILTRRRGSASSPSSSRDRPRPGGRRLRALTTSRRDDRRPIFRADPTIDRTDRPVAAELEAIANTIDPEPASIDAARGEVDQAYTFGVRTRDTDEIE